MKTNWARDIRVNYQLLRERFETRLCLLKDLGEKNDDRRQADHLWCTNTSRSGSSPRRRFDLRATSGRESTVLLSSFRFVIYCRFSQNAAWSRVEKGARKSFTAIPRRFSFCPSLEDSKRTIYIIQYPRNEEHVTGFRESRSNFYHPFVEIDLYCNFKRIILKFRSQIAILIYPQIFFLDLFRFISQRNGKILDSNILFFFLQCNLRRW